MLGSRFNLRTRFNLRIQFDLRSWLGVMKESRLPAGVECHKVFYQPERVGASLGTFVINLIESVIIVVVILMLAMGFKSGIIIGISLIVTVFGSFLFLYTADGTMQRVSLAAFVLAMGMLVDNASISTEAYSTIQSVFEDADVIYFTGGNSFFLMDQLRKTGTDGLLKKELANGKLMIGEIGRAHV